jgi:hypothetical protein
MDRKGTKEIVFFRNRAPAKEQYGALWDIRAERAKFEFENGFDFFTIFLPPR